MEFFIDLFLLRMLRLLCNIANFCAPHVISDAVDHARPSGQKVEKRWFGVEMTGLPW